MAYPIKPSDINVKQKPNGTIVLSPDGKKLANYEGAVEVLGVDSEGNLYTLYDTAQEGNQTEDDQFRVCRYQVTE